MDSTSQAPVPRPALGASTDRTGRARGSGIGGSMAAFTSAGPLAALGFGSLMLLACNVNAVLGHRAVLFKRHYAHAFVLFVVVAGASKLYRHWPVARGGVARAAGSTAFWFLLFCGLIGASELVSNGTSYQAMASNYWDADPFGSTSRRIGLPVLANVLGSDKNGYAYVWYATLFVAFALALRYLGRSRLGAFEKLSLLSSSIFAYSLIGPGYNEVFVFLLGFYALQFRLGLTEKIIVATMMIATHETATPFVMLAVVLHGEEDERGTWLRILGLLYLAYGAAYLFTWRSDVLHALMTAGKPSPDASDNSVGLMLRYPLRALLGVFLAYKLYWIVVLAALGRRASRPMALAVLSSLILAVIGTDTSRLVEFSSLAFLILMAATLPTLPAASRLGLALVNLLIPSLYVATNAEPLWGNGLYSIYLYGARAAGLGWGRPFVQ